MKNEDRPKSFLREYKIPIVTAGVILILGGSTVSASNKAAPGDLLYPMDLALENLQQSLINNPDKRAEFKKILLDERKDEKDDAEGEDKRELDDRIEELEDEIEELEAPEEPEAEEAEEESEAEAAGEDKEAEPEESNEESSSE